MSERISSGIRRQRRKVIVVYPDIKLCREEILKSPGVNPGVRWAAMHMAKQLPYIVMIAAIKAQIGKVVQVDFLLLDLNAHRHCNVLEPIYESLPDILEVMITENEVDSAVQAVKNLIPFIRTTEAEVTEMESHLDIGPNIKLPAFVKVVDVKAFV